MSAASDEDLWAGWYGIQYTTKFTVDWRERIPLLRWVLDTCALAGHPVRSVLDVGTNAAWNLRALRDIDPSLQLEGLEINQHVAITGASMEFLVTCGNARHLAAHFRESAFDLVMTSGVLIHLPPEHVEEAMRAIARVARRWVLAIEYPSDVEIAVRKHGDTPRAWARPYCELYEQLGLRFAAVDYGAEGYPECRAWLLEKP
jgi:hypothetical protein